MPSRAPWPNKQNHLTGASSLCHFHPADHIITLKATRQLSDCLTNYTAVEWGKLENKGAENKTNHKSEQKTDGKTEGKEKQGNTSTDTEEQTL